VADVTHQAHPANQHVPLLLFARPVLTHSMNSTKKKWLLSAGFECAKGWCMLWKWHAFSQIAPPPPSKNKFALAINACWQNFFYDMCLPTLLKNTFNTWLALKRLDWNYTVHTILLIWMNGPPPGSFKTDTGQLLSCFPTVLEQHRPYSSL
jgi:hypothetical protein